LKGRGFSRAARRFQWFTARLGSRALSKTPTPGVFPQPARAKRHFLQELGYSLESKCFNQVTIGALLRPPGYNTRVKPSIFVVEDDPDISRLVRHHLEGADSR